MKALLLFVWLLLPGIIYSQTFSKTLSLDRGPFSVVVYAQRKEINKYKGVILFGSGCGGWSYWEDRVSQKLETEGFVVVGIDYVKYASEDYNEQNLRDDYKKIADFGLSKYGLKLPVIFGGWSTGAEEAVAAACGSQTPSGLIGLLLISPGNSVGFGKYALDYINWNAPANRIVSLSKLASCLPKLRIVQWHATMDMLDSFDWFTKLSQEHREYDFQGAFHDYNGASDPFLDRLAQSVQWLLLPSSAAKNEKEQSAL